MNTPRTTPRLALTLAAVAAACTLAGYAAGASAQDLSASADVVHARVMGHPYQNGGVSREDVARMDQHMGPYNLRLTFSEGRHNDYAAGLKLDIRDSAGKRVFALDEAGPLTDLALPAGRYEVVADFGGVKRSAFVDVKANGPAAELYLHWPKDET